MSYEQEQAEAAAAEERRIAARMRPYTRAHQRRDRRALHPGLIRRLLIRRLLDRLGL